MIKRILSLILVLLLFFTEAKAENLSAVSAVLYEPVTGRILMSKNPNIKLPMASTTKILTAITVIENCKLDEIAVTSYNASVIEGSSIWLEEGEKMTVENLLYGLLLSSGNDAATVLAEHVSGDTIKFSHLMNDTAKKAGAKNSNFTNPSGLDDEQHYTTAEDLAKITAYALNNDIFRKIVSTEEKVIPWEGHEWGRTLKNHNKLLKLYKGAEGVKTGYTKKDGRCLVGTATRNNVRLITVTLNAPDDWNDHIKMFDYGFSRIKLKNYEIKSYPVKLINGIEDNVTIMAKNEFLIPCTDKDIITVKNVHPDFVNAPINKGDILGYNEIYINDKMVSKIPLLAVKSVEKKFIPDFKFYFKNLLRYFCFI